MNILKSLIFIILIALNIHARSMDDIKKSGKIIIAVYKDFPPYSFKEKGVAKGIDVDLGKKVAKALGVKPVWYFTGFDEDLAADLRNAISRGNKVHKNKADVMFRIPYDYKYMRLRDKQTGELQNDMITIKGPYQSEKWVIATHKDIIPKITTLGIFAYQTIGVEVDMLPDLHLSGFAGGILRKNVKHYRNFNDAIKDFKLGKIDAIAGLKTQLEYLLKYKNNKDKYYISDNIPLMKSKWDLATAVQSNYRALSYFIDGVIEKAFKNGEIKDIFNKYGVEYLPPSSRTL
jgi:ABC-type amino acid transport substrate-binding protein